MSGLPSIDEAIDGARGVPRLLKTKSGWYTAAVLIAIGVSGSFGFFKAKAALWELQVQKKEHRWEQAQIYHLCHNDGKAEDKLPDGFWDDGDN